MFLLLFILYFSFQSSGPLGVFSPLKPKSGADASSTVGKSNSAADATGTEQSGTNSSIPHDNDDPKLQQQTEQPIDENAVPLSSSSVLNSAADSSDSKSSISLAAANASLAAFNSAGVVKPRVELKPAAAPQTPTKVPAPAPSSQEVDISSPKIVKSNLP